MIDTFEIDINQDCYQEVNLYSDNVTTEINCEPSGIKVEPGNCQEVVQIFDQGPCPINITVPPPTEVSNAWSNFSQGTPDSVLVTDESTPLLLSNPNRLYASFVNNTSQKVYIQYGIPAVYSRGKFLFPNSERDIKQDELYTGPVYAICSSGQTALIDVIEGVK